MLDTLSNPFAYDLVISKEVQDFPSARKILFTLLMEWSKSLSDPEDDCIFHIAEMLEDLGSKFDIIKMIAYEDGASPGRCYGMKCDVIRTTLHDVRKRLTKDQESRFQMAEALDMLSKHIGRLSLNGYGCEDVFAFRMDTMIDVVELRFHERTPEEDPEEERKQIELYAMWSRLCVAMPSCACLQCGKRLVLNIEM